ncbi:hypothetical protein MRX96_035293 [Rhipicephalus microplus]
MSSSRSRRRKAGGLHGYYVRSVSSFDVADTTSSKSGPEPEPASRGTLGPSQPVPQPPSRGTFSPSHYVKPSRGSNQSVCTNPWCRFTTQWLRTKLDFYKDPCKDFYSYVCGTHKGPSQLTQTADLAAWMKNMDLDFNDEERLSNVEPLDMIVRCSLDLGVPAVVSLELQEQAFYQGKRVIKLDLSEKEKKWLNDRLQRPEHVNANDYARLLALYGVQPRRYTELAANLSGYEKELRNIINRNPEKDPRFVAINSIPMKFRKPYNAEAIISRPLYNHRVPEALNYGALGTIVGHEMMHAYDVRGIEYDEEAAKWFWRSAAFMREYTKRTLCLRRSHRAAERQKARSYVDHAMDSENMADFVGVRTAYKAFSALPERKRTQTLVGTNITSERLFFIAHCVKWCAERNAPEPYYSPFRSRCMVPLMNMPEFSDAFGCAAGENMNPPEKCDFWQ